MEVKILLDTSAYSAFKRNHPSVIKEVGRSHEIAFSTAVAGELLSGFRQGTRFEKNLEELLEFLAHPQVRLTPITWSTADRYGRIAAALRRKGRPIPSNDMWIAAQAMETGAELLTFDQHFKEIDGLVLNLLSHR